ncbi:MAG: ribosomal protein S18-alanine N-acetyltransferase [Eubacteriales bacterium]|nr:ribosomal protein S18-alanine N-acetyltransferase [Eubacteriales bacterium]
MKDIVVRDATQGDIDAIAILENQTQFEVYSLNEIKDMYDIDYYTIKCAVLDDKILGHIVYTKIIDECNLIKIIVDKSCRQNGVGRLLIESMINDCKEHAIKKIYFEVRSDNNVAINFYERLGFNFENIRPNYYGSIDAKIYGMNIDEK